MHASIRTVAFRGIETVPVEVQVHVANGLPSMAIVGLADKAVGESRERVRAALASIGLALPPKRIAINLAPADLVKEGAHFDLPIALGLLVAIGSIPHDSVAGHLVLGELSLHGAIEPVSGVLPAAMAAVAGDLNLICPQRCGAEAAWASDLSIVAAPDMMALLNHLRGRQILPAPKAECLPPRRDLPDMADLRGQETARRLLEIAAAGAHNLLMVGPPGAGKSMLAARFPGLLPPLTPREALDVTMLHSVAGTLPAGGLVQSRPFRDPHHSASMAALVGGGARARPGEISLAHGGVLFLDELAEFAKPALDALRQPLETGQVIVARANHHVTYPARFQLIAAMNPCRCGYLGDPHRACGRAPECGRRSCARISGPMLDRFDMVVEVPEVSGRMLLNRAPGESSTVVAARVVEARSFAAERMPLADAGSDSPLHDVSAEATTLLEQALDRHSLSARGFHRILRVARTIADLAAMRCVDRHHIAEALAYRAMPLLA